MEEPRNLLRYAIPGWLFLVHLLIFGLIHELAVGPVLLLKIMESGRLDISLISLLVIIVAALGVPLGYLISQVYFAVYWREERPLVWLADLLRLPRWPLLPNWVDHRRVARQARELGLVPAWWPAQSRREAWDIVIFLWYTAPSKSELKWAEKKGETLANIYHSLGATYFALWLAFVTYWLAYLAAKLPFAPWAVVGTFVGAVLLSLSYAQAQRPASESLETFTERALLGFYGFAWLAR